MTPEAGARPGRLRQRLARFDKHFVEVLRGAAVSAAVKGAAVVLGLLFSILLARMLGPDGAGMFFICLSLLTLATAVGRLGLDQAGLRFVAAAHEHGDWSSVHAIHRAVMRRVAIASLVCSLSLALGAELLASQVFSDPRIATPLRMMAIAVVPMSLLLCQANLLRAMRRILWYSLLQGQTGACIALFALMLGAPLMHMWQLSGAVSAYIVAILASTAISYRIWRREVPDAGSGSPTASPEAMAELHAVARELFWGTIARVLTQQAPVLLLGVLASASDVGMFSIALRISVLLTFVLNAVNSISSPKFAAFHRRGDLQNLERTARNTAVLMAALCVPLALPMVIAPHWILSWFGDAIPAAAPILVVLAVAQYLNVAAGSVGPLMAMCGEQRALRNVLVMVLLVNVALGAALIPGFAGLGAAIAMAVGVVLRNVTQTIYVRKALDIASLPLMPAVQARRGRGKPLRQQGLDAS